MSVVRNIHKHSVCIDFYNTKKGESDGAFAFVLPPQSYSFKTSRRSYIGKGYRSIITEDGGHNVGTLVLSFPVFGDNSYVVYLGDGSSQLGIPGIGGGNLREMNMHNLLKHFRDVVMNYDLKKDTELRLYDWTLRNNTLVSDKVASAINKIGIDLSSSKEDQFIVTLGDCTITRNGTNPYAMTFEVSFNVIESLNKKIKSKKHSSFFDEIDELTSAIGSTARSFINQVVDKLSIETDFISNNLRNMSIKPSLVITTLIDNVVGVIQDFSRSWSLFNDGFNDVLGSIERSILNSSNLFFPQDQLNDAHEKTSDLFHELLENEKLIKKYPKKEQDIYQSLIANTKEVLYNLNQIKVQSKRMDFVKKKSYLNDDEIVSYFNYLMRSEDSLEKLADRFLLDWEKWTDIARYNDIKNSDDIKVGDVIKIPLFQNNIVFRNIYSNNKNDSSLGRDIYLNNKKNLEEDEVSKDWVLIDGEDNVKQSLMMRLSQNKSIYHKGVYGFKIPDMSGELSQSYLKERIRNTIMEDSRVLDIIQINIEEQEDTIQVDIVCIIEGDHRNKEMSLHIPKESVDTTDKIDNTNKIEIIDNTDDTTNVIGEQKIIKTIEDLSKLGGKKYLITIFKTNKILYSLEDPILYHAYDNDSPNNTLPPLPKGTDIGDDRIDGVKGGIYVYDDDFLKINYLFKKYFSEDGDFELFTILEKQYKNDKKSS